MYTTTTVRKGESRLDAMNRARRDLAAFFDQEVERSLIAFMRVYKRATGES